MYKKKGFCRDARYVNKKYCEGGASILTTLQVFREENDRDAGSIPRANGKVFNTGGLRLELADAYLAAICVNF
jgi:hypothetical protein